MLSLDLVIFIKITRNLGFAYTFHVLLVCIRVYIKVYSSKTINKKLRKKLLMFKTKIRKINKMLFFNIIN